MSTRRTHYETLHVPSTVDGRTISRAYRTIAKRYHPDRDHGPDALRIMLAVNAAYEVLKHPDRRAAYDASLKSDALDRAWPSSRSGTPRPTAGAQASVWHHGPGTPAASSAPAPEPMPARPAKPDVEVSSDAERVAEESDVTLATGDPDEPARPRPRAAAPTGPGAGPGSDLALDFGRYEGWTLAAVHRADPEYLDWLARSSGGRKYAAGIAALRAHEPAGGRGGLASALDAARVGATPRGSTSRWRRGRA